MKASIGLVKLVIKNIGLSHSFGSDFGSRFRIVVGLGDNGYKADVESGVL